MHGGRGQAEEGSGWAEHKGRSGIGGDWTVR